MKTKILFLLIFAFLSANLFAQTIYLPSEKKYVKITDYIDDIQKDLSKFSSDYLLIYPGYDAKENSEGDAYLVQLELRVSSDGKYVTAEQTLQIPQKESVKTDKLTNPSFYDNNFNCDEWSGKFVVIKYKKKDATFSAKGILKKHKKDEGYDFYERVK